MYVQSFNFAMIVNRQFKSIFLNPLKMNRFIDVVGYGVFICLYFVDLLAFEDIVNHWSVNIKYRLRNY